MDLATIFGIIIGMGLVIFTILSGSGSAMIFVHIPSMAVVFGGAVAATLVHTPLGEVISAMKVAANAFRVEPAKEPEIIEQFVELAKKARREGILAIDKELDNIEDDFMRSGLEMAVDGSEPETIRNVLEAELQYLIERHKRGKQIFSSLGMYAPAFGMIGTLIGLIAMLQNLDDPSNIGGGMAVALITTFYGSLIANLIFLPLAGKLQNRSDEEITRKEMIIEGVIAIQYGEHPKNIHRKLLNFIAPRKRNNGDGE